MKISIFTSISIFTLSLQLLTSCKKSEESSLGVGLMAHYKFNNNIEDYSGKGNNGTAFGGSFNFELNRNGIYSFNGNGDYIKVNNSQSLNPTNAITISLWFKPVDYYGTGYDALVLKPYTSHTAPYYQYILGIGGNRGLNPYSFAFNVNINGVNTGINSGANMWTGGNWYHVLATYNGHELGLYINGELKKSVIAEGTITAYDTDIFLAKQANIGTTTPGAIDEVRIYNRAITRQEILEIYQKSF